MNIGDMQQRIEALEASRVAQQIVLAALIKYHPQYGDMQLFLTRLLEQQLGGGALGRLLTPAQREYAREAVEWMQAIDPQTAQPPRPAPAE